MIRLACALLVILSHCCLDKDPILLLTHGVLWGSGIAMPAFFFLSGLLVAQSLRNSPTRLDFLRKRVLRLYPAAIASLLLTAFLMGPLVTSLSPGAYFTHPVFRRYCLNIFLVELSLRLPGVFTHSPIGPSVNASLWSLALEWKCYAGLFLLSFVGNRHLRLILLLLLLALLLAAGFFSTPIETAGISLLHSVFVLGAYSHLMVFFIIGILCQQFAHRIVIHPWWPLAIAILGSAAARLGFFFYASFLLLPATLLFLAVTAPYTLRRLTPRPDLSYGLYVLAFPIEQLIVNYLHIQAPYPLLLATLAFTLPAAALSWYAVESPALKTKKAVRDN